MYLTDEILDKLNATGKTKNSSLKAGTPERITLPDIMVRSFAEVKELAGDTLSWGEKNFLYQQAQKELKENKMAESRILGRANPQLANAIRLGIRQSPMLGSYDDLFPQRASSFVKPGSVASMFSPAGYLTELYREARNLHADTSQYHLDTRRPDLASLSLSQNNMDDELSTLSLSNELCLNNIQSQESLDYDGTLEMLSTYRQTGATPYNQPYEAVRQSIILQDPDFTAFRNNPAVAAEMNTASLLGIQADISPELHKILTEEITEAKADELIKENFGDIEPSAFQSIAYLARWYGVSFDEMSSLLSLVTSSDNIATGVQYYQDDQLVALNSSNGALVATLIKREYYSNSDLNWIEVIPVGDDTYSINLSFKNVYSGFNTLWIGSSRDGNYSSDIVSDDENVLIANKTYSYTHKLTTDDKGLYLWVGRYNSTTGTYMNGARVNFIATGYNFDVFLLKLNKLIRLYKATGIAPSDIRTVIESSNNDLTITDTTLSQLFRVDYYMQTYGIDVSAALVLAGSVISQINHSNTLSAFTRLFNSPPLNNQLFSADGTALSLKPGASDDTFRLGVLKRALQVNDTELYTLWGLTGTKFTATIDKLSALYRTRLLAEIHGLSVTELGMLLSVSPYAGNKLGSLKDTVLSGLISFIAQYTQWLKDQNWTVSDLYLMLTGRFSTTLTPDIENLVATLKNGLASQDLSQASETELITAAAPFIAAATQLDSAGTAEAILQWLDQLKPQNLTVAGFLTLAGKDSRTDAETASLVAWCQVVGQLALIVRSIGLNEAELSFVVTHPDQILRDAKVLPQDIGTLYELTALHNMLSRCGVHASEIITALAKGRLEVSSLATVLTLDEQALAQALQRVSSYKYFYNWIGVSGALQWLNVATSLHISPANVKALTELTTESPYADWMAASHFLQGGLDTWQTAQLNATLDEALSAAASAYVIKNIAPDRVIDRDKLYGWLLIDNQVSAQIRTTRVAEAIASLQLYVNRALSGQENGVDNKVKAGQFFSADWDTYNKRYSTWAGVSELVYYPENYVDPTMRLGQTHEMDDLLQQLSQSQINSDNVGDAVKSYLTAFDEVANLQTANCYHDNPNSDSGFTWFIGFSQTEPKKYYWRKVDHSKRINGKFTANAWSEWTSIDCAITPVNNLIRPVTLGSRLYIAWVEEKTSRDPSDSSKEIVEYYLKITHIRYDGSWVAPYSTPVTDKIDDLTSVGFYISESKLNDSLVSVFFKKSDSYSSKSLDSKGVFFFPGGIFSSLTDAVMDNYKSYIVDSLDTLTQVNSGTIISGDTISSIDVNTEKGKSTNLTLSTVIKDASINYDDENDLILKFTPSFTLNLNFTGDGGGDNLLLLQHVFELDSIIFISDLAGEAYTGGNATFSIAEKLTMIYKETASLKYYICINDTALPVNVAMDVFIVQDSGEKAVTSSSVYTGSHITIIEFSMDEELSGEGFIELRNGSEGLYKINYTSATDSTSLYIFPNPESIYIKVDDETIVSPKKITGDAAFNGSYEISDGGVTVNFSAISFALKNIPWSPDVGEKKYDVLFESSISYYENPLTQEELTNTITISLLHSSVNKNELLSLHSAGNAAQYIEWGAYRTRLNTLFARQLIDRANAGIDAVLTMDTQKIQEPKLGEGTYLTLVLSPYDKSIHGGSSEFKIYMANVFKMNDSYVLAGGVLSDRQQTTLTLFVPRLAGATGNPDNLYLYAEYDSGITAKIKLTRSDTNDPEGWALATNKFKGLDSVLGLAQKTEPMDFSGANALYFWELFYYTPMFVFKRLLQEDAFSDATSWMHYVWNPAGYLVDGEMQNYVWNVRPLEEETTWHADPLDSVDPDAVAQADPLHYKVTTFMSYLDLLIARGDSAYRQLERDTLNEAKMWYVQALDMLGDEPYLTENASWASPRLADAADKTTQKDVQQALLAVRQQIKAGELRTANSLTGLFLPQQNERLAGYWQTLAQRLYNLRHNLSIDGQPLSLSVYAAPADPAALLSAAVNASSGGGDLPAAVMPLYRFPVILDSARSLVNQLTQFGSTLLSITERQDAEALSELLQTQGSALVLQSVALQDKEIAALDADRAALTESRSGAQSRLDSYTTLYDEDVNTGEKQAMDLFLSSSVIADGGQAFHTTAGALDLAPNIFGLADGGSRWGAAFTALGSIADLSASATRTAGERISQSEAYRRRRQEWEIQRNAAQSDVKQMDAQLASLAVRREAAVLQKTYLETQQSQTQAQMTFLQNKFSSKALYNWLRGKLAAIYYQFYDLTVSRCLMAQESYKWSLGTDSATFIRPGAWQGTYAGLMAGETLMLNLAQMEQSYLQKDEREKEVVRTVCLSEAYAGQADSPFTLADEVVTLVTAGSGSAGTNDNGLKMADNELQATLKLADLNIHDDYPASLGNTRRIKQVSVTLPALVGPYQDVRAVLSYGGSVILPQGCQATAVSHGMNDSGQFQLDFSDSRWLPFEGIPVSDAGTLTLSFPDAKGKQKGLLLSLTDIILHIRYTIVS